MFSKHWFLVVTGVSVAFVAIGAALGFIVLTPSSRSPLLWLVLAFIVAGFVIGLLAVVVRTASDIKKLFR